MTRTASPFKNPTALDALFTEWMAYREIGGKLTWKEFKQSSGVA